MSLVAISAFSVLVYEVQKWIQPTISTMKVIPRIKYRRAEREDKQVHAIWKGSRACSLLGEVNVDGRVISGNGDFARRTKVN